MDRQVKQDILALVEGSRDAIACSIDENGYPNAKTMFRARNEGLQTFWFSTNTSAIRTGHWQKRPEASIYFVDHEGFHGLMLTGRMQVLTDDEIKASFWNEGDEKYYPLGPTDPDYCILRFTADKGNYYHGLRKHLFSVDEARGW
ncbi:pyridoxamine 5'-phosphate oxidase family protein [Gorillibacterium massiliense]|uniref:pyridoxamine 5'-phosphate oxidase family protein n=1 Tax=Gorillibacterium massiliense TaxID=1280390 RepID=UPI0004B688D5|nr:pyridoxamine 5'-phosphate oxidase family protein [Gorillibacterium massiliense]